MIEGAYNYWLADLVPPYIFDTGGLEIPIAAGKIVQINGTSPEWIFTFIVGLRVSSQSLLDWTNDAL